MSDAVEAARQDMKQEAADELVRGEHHDLLTVGAVTAVTLHALPAATAVQSACSRRSKHLSRHAHPPAQRVRSTAPFQSYSQKSIAHSAGR